MLELSEFESPIKGPLRGKPGTLEVLRLSQPQSLLLFTAKSFGNLSSQHWKYELGSLVWDWDSSLLTGGMEKSGGRNLCS